MKSEIKRFIEIIKKEATYSKGVKNYILVQIIDMFDIKCEKQSYPKSINNPLEVALNFYKNFNNNYYKLIIEGLKNKKIIINSEIEKSYVDTYNNIAYIKFENNDGDLITIVHELAHFIDRKLNLISNEYNILCEVFSFYMERQLEKYLIDEKYKNIFLIRENNRLYFESKLIKKIKLQLYYEKLYLRKSQLTEEDINVEDIKKILNGYEENQISYLLRYILANMISYFLIENDIQFIDSEICNLCFSIDLQDIINYFHKNKKNLLNK